MFYHTLSNWRTRSMARRMARNGEIDGSVAQSGMQSSVRPRRHARLRASDLKKLPPGMHADGANLYLRIKPTGAASWVFRYRAGAALCDVGLGGLGTVSLAEARAKALRLAVQRADGIDPRSRITDARRAANAAATASRRSKVTFAKALRAYIEAHQAGWSSPQHARNWWQQLAKHALPTIGETAIENVDTGAVLDVLRPIWADLPETASRIRLRVEKVLDFARVHGWRDGDNPARWSGHLQHILAPNSRAKRVEHFTSLPWQDLPAFYRLVAGRDAVSARALQFCILTAVRTGEIIGATWAEIDLENATWSISADRMKARRPHIVPLSTQALEILRAVHPLNRGAKSPVFPSPRGGHPSNLSMIMLLRRMNRGELTVHGFRSTFRTWAAETTDFASEIAESCLAHAVGSAVTQAYLRTSFLDRRRELMQRWGDFATGQV